MINEIIKLRYKLEQHFSKDTAVPGTKSHIPSAGHCAVVAIIAHIILGAEIVSAVVKGQSHWFNRIVIDGEESYFDLTGDQFGFPAFLIDKIELYPGTRLRRITEANAETIERAKLLAQRAGLDINDKLKERE